MLLNSCEFSPLHKQLSHASFIHVFQAVYEILNAILLKHTQTALSTIPAFLGMAKQLLVAVILRSDQGGEHSDNVEELVQCAGLIER
jgi:hypothetical protein